MNKRRALTIGALSVLVALAAGCGDRQHSRSAHNAQHRHAIVVHQYREKVSNDSFLYWYIYLMPGNGASGSSAYYYRSSAPVSNFSGIAFTRSSGNLPKSVEEELERSEQLPDERVSEEQEPQEIVNEEAAESPSGNSDTQTESAAETSSSSESTSSSDSSSSDSSSSSE
jgi:hypothetical protein